MSIECLNKALKIEGLTPTKKLILVLLANYADEKKTCYPSYAHIAKIVGLKTTKGIKSAIKEFEQLGYLKIINRKAEHGGYISNLYRLTLDKKAMVELDPRVAENTRVGLPDTHNTKEETKTNIYTDHFETFWKKYPRKVGKHKAAMTFEKSLQYVFFDDLMRALKIFISENERTETQFIPHASTWLNQKRFLDYKDKKEPKKINLNKIAG
jgi:hypothetical protein